MTAGASTPMRAVVLAGGKGTRLQPFTINFPKPLVPVGDTPILEVLMRRLIRCGILDITLALGHMAELVKTYLEHRPELVKQIRLSYVQEQVPTGTAGAIALVPDLRRTFLVMNGDLLTNVDFNALVEHHRKQRALLTIATHTRRVKIDLGVLQYGADYGVTGYVEKPESTHHVSMGVYVYEPAVLECIPVGEYLDFPDLVLRLLARGARVCAYPTDCLWLDIGRPDDYARAQELFAERKDDFDLV